MKPLGHDLHDSDLQDTPSVGDWCPSKTLLQEDLAAFSKVNDLLHHWKVEAEVVLGTELSSDAFRNCAEA